MYTILFIIVYSEVTSNPPRLTRREVGLDVLEYSNCNLSGIKSHKEYHSPK